MKDETKRYGIKQRTVIDGDIKTYQQEVDVKEINRRDKYLTYVESLDEHDINVVLRIGESYAKIQRRGVINMNFHFEEGLFTDTFYESPAGRHHFRIKTHRLDINEDEIYIEYVLYEQEEVLGEYQYKLTKVG